MSRHRNRSLRTVCAALLASVTVACSGPTGTGTSDPRVAGTWQYRAATTTSTAMVEGSLRLIVSSSGGIEGTLDAMETDASGRRSSVSGIVSGRVITVGTADFELALTDGRRREHFVTLRGDSLVGDWVESAGHAMSVTGRFVAPRRAP